MTLIIRDALKEQMRRQAILADDRPFAHPSHHSDEAKNAWSNFIDPRGGILLPNFHGDWFALGYDAALKAAKSK